MQRLLPTLTLSLFFLTACQHGEPPRPAMVALPKVVVQVAAARLVSRVDGDEVVGTVRARTVSAVSASVMGTVRELRVAVGSRVRAGDVLVRLAAGEIDAKAEQARARFLQAEINMKRAEGLKAREAMASSTYDTANAEFRVAQAALSEAEVMTGYTVIRAPVAGVVTEKLADVGDLALPGRPLLVIENPDVLRLEAPVPEANAASIHAGDALQVRIDALGKQLMASVVEVNPTADPASRTVVVKLDLPKDASLRSGMFGRLLLSTQADAALTVPRSALVRRGQLDTLFVVQNDTAKLRLVRTGRTLSDAVEILAGLSERELVVLDDPARLRDGQPVESR